MYAIRDPHGRFLPGNKTGTGRPKGSPNRHKAPRFSKAIYPRQRFLELLHGIAGDLGGVSELSVGQAQMARRCAILSMKAEEMERAALKGEPFDLNAYAALTDKLGRAFERLGFERRAKDTTLMLSDYITAQRAMTSTQPDVAEPHEEPQPTTPAETD